MAVVEWSPGATIALVNLAAWAAAVAVVYALRKWACRVAVAAWRWGWLTPMREEW